MENNSADGYEQLPPIGEDFQDGSEGSIGFAVAAFVLGLASVLGFFCCSACVTIITAPLAVIFGIIALARRNRGTGLSVTGLVMGALCLVILVAFLVAFKDLFRYMPTITEDFTRLSQEQDEVFPAYEADGTLPDYLKKYLEPPFSDFFAKYDGTFYDVMDYMLSIYKDGQFPVAPDFGSSLAPQSSFDDGVLSPESS